MAKHDFPIFDRKASYQNWRRWYFGLPKSEPPPDYSQLTEFTEALKMNDLAPWEDEYFDPKEGTNIVDRMIEINAGYIDENPRIQYYMRQAYIAGTLEAARNAIDADNGDIKSNPNPSDNQEALKLTVKTGQRLIK